MTINFNYWKTRVVRYPLLAIAGGAAIATTGMYFDLNKSEWASWVQALGSIAAIVGAYLIADFQHRRQVEAERRNKLENEKRKLEIASAFLNEIVLAAVVIKHEVSGPHAGANSRATITYLASQIDALQQLPMMEIPDAQLVSKIVSLVKVAKEFDMFMQPYIGNHALPNLEDDRRDRIAKEVERLSATSCEANNRCELALSIRR